MTENLEKTIAVAQALPPEQQDDVARVRMLVAGEEVDDVIVELSADEEEALRIGIEPADRGRFATDEQVRATFAEHER